MSNENKQHAAVRVCAISDVQCSRGCGAGPCKKENKQNDERAAFEEVMKRKLPYYNLRHQFREWLFEFYCEGRATQQATTGDERAMFEADVVFVADHTLARLNKKGCPGEWVDYAYEQIIAAGYIRQQAKSRATTPSPVAGSAGQTNIGGTHESQGITLPKVTGVSSAAPSLTQGSAGQAPDTIAPAGAVNLACYLVDHCEGETITEESIQRWIGAMVKLPRYNPTIESELASMTRMFHAACADLGAINEALGLDPDDGGAEPILEAIADLKQERDNWVDANYASPTAPSLATGAGAVLSHSNEVAIAKQYDIDESLVRDLWREFAAMHSEQRMSDAARVEWQPIETAPKDREIWAFNGEQGRMIWSEGHDWALWIWADPLLSDADPCPEQPTHWREFPAAPIDAARKAEIERSGSAGGEA